MDQKLRDIENAEKSTRTELYSALLYNSFVMKQFDDVKSIFDHLTQNSQDIIITRPLVDLAMEAAQEQEAKVEENLSLYFLACLQFKTSFEQEEANLRENLTNLYIKKGEYKQAASQLKQISVDSSHRHVEDPEKIRIWLKTAHCYLECEEGVDAEIYTNKASQLLSSSHGPQLALLFRESFSGVMDFKRKFIEAARNYFSLACDVSLEASKRQKYLHHSCQCAILSKAGIQRSRIISTLCKDERSKSYPHYELLLAMDKERLLPRSTLKEFAAGLKEHQKAMLADGSSVLDQALMLHNVSAARNLYTNISFQQLGELLGISRDKAESAAANLIEEKRIEGYIDQIDGALYFSHHVQNSVPQWDIHIRNVCATVNDVVEVILEEHPLLLG